VKTRLLLGAGVPVRVTVNGREVYRGTPAVGSAQPDRAGVDVELAKGANAVVVEATYRGEKQVVYVRFHDPERKLTYPEPAAGK
jgi:hypothetical protein